MMQLEDQIPSESIDVNVSKEIPIFSSVVKFKKIGSNILSRPIQTFSNHKDFTKGKVKLFLFQQNQ